MQAMTEWLVVAPLDFKKYILQEVKKMQMEDKGPPDIKKTKSYSKWKTCAICMCELFPDPFEESTVEEIEEQQKTLVQNMKDKVKLNEYQEQLLQVVMMGKCTGEPHMFHIECLQGHFNSTKDA